MTQERWLNHDTYIAHMGTRVCGHLSAHSKVVVTRRLSTEADACKYSKTMREIALQQTIEDDIIRTCEKLLSFSNKHPLNQQVHVDCASVICSVFDDIEKEANRQDLLIGLKALVDDSDSEQVAVLYASILEDLSIMNEGILDELKQLLEMHPGNESILDSYGYALHRVIRETGYSPEYKQLARKRFAGLREHYPDSETLRDLLR